MPIKSNPLPSVDEIKAALSYDDVTGTFRWKISPCGRAKIGQIAGSSKDGYRVIRLSGVRYPAHRLAFKIIYGRDPIEVDHKSGHASDARHNLREADRSQNNRNMPRRHDNKSGYKGVYWATRSRKWVAMIGVDGKQRHLGAFTEKQAAYAAYCAAATELHGEFARLS